MIAAILTEVTHIRSGETEVIANPLTLDDSAATRFPIKLGMTM